MGNHISVIEDNISYDPLSLQEKKAKKGDGISMCVDGAEIEELDD